MHSDGTASVTATHIVQGMSEEFKQKELPTLIAVARSIVKTFGSICEVVIHDFSDLEHSIVWIEGDVTGRCVGGSVTNLGLQYIQNGMKGDPYGYTTHTDDGKTLKSSSVFLRDHDGNMVGAFCINIDVGPLVSAEQILHALTHRDDSSKIVETFSDDIDDILEGFLQEAESEIGKPGALMSKDERIDLVSRLDAKGAFQVKRSVPMVAERLNVSRYTVYNYLNEIHARSDSSGSDW